MENPDTWTEVERTIYDALEEIHEARKNFVCGASEPRIIADALRAKGLIKE